MTVSVRISVKKGKKNDGKSHKFLTRYPIPFLSWLIQNILMAIQEVPAFRDFWFQRVIMKCGDHEFRGLFLV